MGVFCTFAGVSKENSVFACGQPVAAILACLHAGGQPPATPGCMVHLAHQPSRLVLTGKNAV
jgi:hypothetical protein